MLITNIVLFYYFGRNLLLRLHFWTFFWYWCTQFCQKEKRKLTPFSILGQYWLNIFARCDRDILGRYHPNYREWTSYILTELGHWFNYFVILLTKAQLNVFKSFRLIIYKSYLNLNPVFKFFRLTINNVKINTFNKATLKIEQFQFINKYCINNLEVTHSKTLFTLYVRSKLV